MSDPEDPPELGDLCRLRSNPKCVGVLLRCAGESQICDVAWATEPRGPNPVFYNQLKRLGIPPPIMSTYAEWLMEVERLAREVTV